MFTIKTIERYQLNKLFTNGIIKHSTYGIVSQDDKPTGFYRTKTKLYIEDKYVEIAREL